MTYDTTIHNEQYFKNMYFYVLINSCKDFKLSFCKLNCVLFFQEIVFLKHNTLNNSFPQTIIDELEETRFPKQDGEVPPPDSRGTDPDSPGTDTQDEVYDDNREYKIDLKIG